MPSAASNNARRLAGQQSRVRSQLKGAASTRKLIRRLPQAARDEMAEILEVGGIELLRAMRQDVAERTGALKAGLSQKLLRASLRLRVGLLGKATNRRLFYGIIVEKGRKGQTVQVRNRRNTAPYSLRVRAMAARPFVYKRRPDERGTLSRRLKLFWNETLSLAAEGIGDD